MNAKKIFVIAFLIVSVGYALYVWITMSLTYPSLKEYALEVNRISFEERLTDRIHSSIGWTLERKDTLIGKKETCYWVSLLYETDGNDLEYMIKYCFKSEEPKVTDKCARIEVVTIIDYTHELDRHNMTDKDVEKLLQILDRSVMSDLAPACSNP